MGTLIRAPLDRLLEDADLRAWREIPTSIVSDELNRTAGMNAAIAPLGRIVRFAGEALTVRVMVGDNLALHVAVSRAPAGCVLVVDAGGFTGTAVWGEILHTAAEARRLTAVVIDGAVRDRTALAQSRLPIFTRGATPNGPHKGWGGSINAAVQCGGVAVEPHDLVLGDGDGIAVVPRAQLGGLLERCRRRMQMEAAALVLIREGRTTLEALGIAVAVEEASVGASSARRRGARTASRRRGASAGS